MTDILDRPQKLDDSIMITDFPLNSNVFNFQVNRKACSANITKDELKINLATNRSQFKTETGFNSFVNAVEQGYTIQLGVNEISSKKEDISYIDGFYLDYDECKDGSKKSIPYTELLEIPFIKEHCFACQRSVSHVNDERPRVHFFFLYKERQFDLAKVKKFQLGLKNFLDLIVSEIHPKHQGFDVSVQKNIGQVCFSSTHKIESFVGTFTTCNVDEYMQVFSDYGCVVDEVEEDEENEKADFKLKSASTDNQKPKRIKIDKKRDEAKFEQDTTLSEQFLKYIQDVVVEAQLSGDWTALYNLHEHNFQPDNAENGIAAVCGSNPFSDSDSSKRSFKLTLMDEALPALWYDRSNSVEVARPNNESASGGNYVEYFLHMEKLGLGKANGKKSLQKYKDFKAVYNAICKYWEVPTFKFKSKKGRDADQLLQDLEGEYSTVAPQYVKEIMNSRDYLYYNFKLGIWQVSNNTQHIVKYCLFDAFSIDTIHWLNNDIYAALGSMLPKCRETEILEDLIEFDLSRDEYIVPMKNGDYNTKTKQYSEGYDTSINNSIRMKFDYNPVDESNENVQRLLGFLSKQYSKSVADMLLDWFTLNCVGQAYKAGAIVCIYGQPGTGKSAILRLLLGMTGNLSTYADGNNFFMKDNKFVNADLHGKYSLIIDECEPDIKGWKTLKNLSGGSIRQPIAIERKGKDPFKSLFSGGITTATQDKLYLPNADDGGIRRRLVLVHHTASMYNPEFEGIEELLCTPESLRDIFNYVISRDVNKALKNFKRYHKGENKLQVASVVRESDRVLTFINECLEITNNEDDTLTNKELQSLFVRWLMDACCETWEMGKVQKITKYIKDKCIIKDNNLNWTCVPNEGEEVRIKDITGKFVRGIRGMRVKNSLDIDTSIETDEFNSPQ